MKKFYWLPLLLSLCALTPMAAPSVFFKNLEDGQEVKSPFKVEFSVDGMEVKPAGTMDKGTGHHHIIIDGGFIEAGKIIPADAKHLHYGQGQSAAEISLPPGEHTLTLQFADGLHISLGKELSSTVRIKVVE